MDRRPHDSLVKFGSKARAARIHKSLVSFVHEGTLGAWAKGIERLASNREDFLADGRHGASRLTRSRFNRGSRNSARDLPGPARERSVSPDAGIAQRR